MSILVTFFNKMLQKNGKKEIQQNEVQENVEEWEKDKCSVTYNSVMHEHNCVPFFSDEYNENRSQGHVKGVKVRSWRDANGLQITIKNIIIFVKLYFMTKYLHS